MNPILAMKNVSYSYHTPKGETKALSDISFSVEEGSFTSIVGPSGCGKSTLLSFYHILSLPYYYISILPQKLSSSKIF